MPPAKNAKHNTYLRSFSINNEPSLAARVYHPATNLMPPSPPTSPTGAAPVFTSKQNSSWSRQNSQNGGKYS
ncbi:unnamed protein product [Colias eurytheme]|nr:unnamed protein product [Colias eurytheme]